MLEIIGSFAGSEGTRESADPAAQARNCSFCGLAQIGPELAERHLDRVQVGRVFGQIAKHRTARFDRLADTGGLVRRSAALTAPLAFAQLESGLVFPQTGGSDVKNSKDLLGRAGRLMPNEHWSDAPRVFSDLTGT
jgi:hypothetical protein